MIRINSAISLKKGGEKHENDFNGAGCHGMCNDWNYRHGIGNWQTVFRRKQLRGASDVDSKRIGNYQPF